MQVQFLVYLWCMFMHLYCIPTRSSSSGYAMSYDLVIAWSECWCSRMCVQLHMGGTSGRTQAHKKHIRVHARACCHKQCFLNLVWTVWQNNVFANASRDDACFTPYRVMAFPETRAECLPIRLLTNPSIRNSSLYRLLLSGAGNPMPDRPPALGSGPWGHFKHNKKTSKNTK